VENWQNEVEREKEDVKILPVVAIH